MALQLLLLKEYKIKWSCYEPFPDEIIIKILITLDNLLKTDYYPCKEGHCFEFWKDLENQGKEDNHYHCDCHAIQQKDDGWKCDKCRKRTCKYCIYHSYDIYEYSDSDMIFNYCLECTNICECVDKINCIHYIL